MPSRRPRAGRRSTAAKARPQTLDQARSWRILNSLGQVVAAQNELNNAVFEVRGVALSPGVYSIQVICGDGAVRSAKFTVTE